MDGQRIVCENNRWMHRCLGEIVGHTCMELVSAGTKARLTGAFGDQGSWRGEAGAGTQVPS